MLSGARPIVMRCSLNSYPIFPWTSVVTISLGTTFQHSRRTTVMSRGSRNSVGCILDSSGCRRYTLQIAMSKRASASWRMRSVGTPRLAAQPTRPGFCLGSQASRLTLHRQARRLSSVYFPASKRWAIVIRAVGPIDSIALAKPLPQSWLQPALTH